MRRADSDSGTRRSRRRRWTPAEKSSCLGRFERSGLSVAAYCRRIGISRTTFHRWQEEARGGDAFLGRSTGRFARVELVESLPVSGGDGNLSVRVRAQAGHEAEITGLDRAAAIRIVELLLSGRR